MGRFVEKYRWQIGKALPVLLVLVVLLAGWGLYSLWRVFDEARGTSKPSTPAASQAAGATATEPDTSGSDPPSPERQPGDVTATFVAKFLSHSPDMTVAQKRRLLEGVVTESFIDKHLAGDGPASSLFGSDTEAAEVELVSDTLFGSISLDGDLAEQSASVLVTKVSPGGSTVTSTIDNRQAQVSLVLTKGTWLVYAVQFNPRP